MPRGHKEALRAAARTLLRRKGLQATTARDLVEESGTNLASIGYHFGSKDALMGAALTDLVRDWTERPVTASRAVHGAGQGAPLAAGLRTMLDGLGERRAEVLAALEAVVASGRGDPVGAALPGALRAALAAVAVEVRASAPDLDEQQAAAAAAVIVALHDGLALLSTAVPDAVPAPDAVLAALVGLGADLQPVFAERGGTRR
ncbi:TetR/AcrR family transcriptional regulator [Pseudonocardia sp. CA-107938]|uniref:TetR/AcrR family transcriptional regulator n=1 Tax=Pseudonocardia sp. CA-107938 TaxID=3240021 RepID=UPI003D8AF896